METTAIDNIVNNDDIRLKVVSIHNETDFSTNLESFITYLEHAKVSYLLFPYTIGKEELESELSRINKEEYDILFIEPESIKLFKITEMIEKFPVLTLLEDHEGNTIGFYLPYNSKQINILTYSDIIRRSIDRARSGSLEDDYGRQQSSSIIK